MSFPNNPLSPIIGSTGGDAQAIIDAARTVAAPVDLDPEKPVAFVIPMGAKLEQPNLDTWRDRPSRKTGNKTLYTVDSFIDYVTRHENGDTTVWVHRDDGTVIAVFDDHSNEDPNLEWQLPGWQQHTAKLKLQHSAEWIYWTDRDGANLSQVDFVEHIEGGLLEIIEPDGADMLEIAQSFHATTGATFRSSIRLQSGQQQLLYDEEVQATAGKSGEITVPARFLLALSPWEGEEAVSVAARLRFRVNGGRLMLGYHLDRPDRIVRESLLTILQRLETKFPNVYVGTPT